ARELREGAVAGAVVDADHFVRAAEPAQDAEELREQRLDVRFFVVEGDYHGEVGLHQRGGIARALRIRQQNGRRRVAEFLRLSGSLLRRSDRPHASSWPPRASPRRKGVTRGSPRSATRRRVRDVKKQIRGFQE